MKQLITLSLLLLVGPSLASAQTIQNMNVTSGSMDHLFGTDFPYTIAGPGFSSSGDITPEFQTELDEPVGPGTSTFAVSGNTSEETLIVNSLTVHGVPYEFDGALSAFDSTGTFGAHPGTYHGTFTFFSQFVNETTAGFTTLDLNGGGTVTYDLIPDPDLPGFLEIEHAAFTFKTPEPSTASLLLLGFAALGVQGRRRRSRVTMLQTG